MKSIVNGKEMKAIDGYSIQTIGIPSPVLMERAAVSVAEEIMKEKRVGKTSDILCVAGAGNNGGDAVAVARILHCYGYQTRVCMLGQPDKQTRETKLQLEICKNLQIPVEEVLELENADVIVDGLFGIGINSPVRAPFDQYIRKINEWHQDSAVRLIYAVDMPSGISSDNGQIMGEAIEADVTVTFGYKKCGLILYPGRSFAGKTIVEDIGFPAEALQANPPAGIAMEEADLALLPQRKADSNKGSYGKILLIAGQKNMSGAAYFAGAAAYKTGAGLVRILTPEANRVILQSSLPQAMINIIEETDDVKIDEMIHWCDVIIAGPGVGIEEKTAALIGKFIDRSAKPWVIDADGLNLLAKHPEWYEKLKGRSIVTPHMGEMGRLTGLTVGELKADRAKACREYAKAHELVCIMKDSCSVISDGNLVCYNETGNHGMAKGGSGDVLAGITAAIAGQGADLFYAACLSAYIHGAAGDIAAAESSYHAMTTDDLLDSLRVFFAKQGL